MAGVKKVSILDVVAVMTYLETGKSQIKRADMIEAVGKLGEVMLEDGRVIEAVLANGRKRKARRLAKKRA